MKATFKQMSTPLPIWDSKSLFVPNPLLKVLILMATLPEHHDFPLIPKANTETRLMSNQEFCVFFSCQKKNILRNCTDSDRNFQLLTLRYPSLDF